MSDIADVSMRLLVLSPDELTDAEIEKIIESHYPECEVWKVQNISEGGSFICTGLNKILQIKDGKIIVGINEGEERKMKMFIEVEISILFSVPDNITDSEIEDLVEAQYDCEEAWVTDYWDPEEIQGPITQLVKGQ